MTGTGDAVRVDRTREIVKVSITGIAANALLAAVKIAIGTVSGSIAVRADGVNNLGDALSSVVTLVGARLSVKEPDKKHPFGYGRIESISSLIIGLLIIFAGFSAASDSVQRFIHPGESDYSTPAIMAICAALVIKVALGLYTKRKGTAFESDALTASGKDALNDSLMSAATIVSALLYVFRGIDIEACIGLLIALLVIKTGVETVRDTVSIILGERVSPQLISEVRASIMSFPEVAGVYDIALHSYGRERMIGSAHIEIPESFTAAWIDNLQRSISRKVYEDTGVEMMGVSVYAVNRKNSVAEEMREHIESMLPEFSEVISMHGFYLDPADSAVRFDVVTDFSVRDRAGLSRRVAERVAREYPEYEIEVNVDYDITD